MLKISVMTTTIRDQYTEEQANALKASEFKDFEWVVNDDLYDSRVGRIAEMAGKAFPVVHVKPPVISDHFAVVDALNEGLRHCRGELVYFMVDYVLPHPSALGRHWELYQTYPNCFFSGKSINIGMTAEEFRQKGSSHGEDYRMGLFSNSIFQRRWLTDDIFEAFPDGVINWWAGRNDSAPMEALLKVNGFDIRLDGHQGYQDSDLGQRMMRAGYRYLLDMKASALELKHIRFAKPATRGEQEHQQIAHQVFLEVQAGKYFVNPEINLREERARCLEFLS